MSKTEAKKIIKRYIQILKTDGFKIVSVYLFGSAAHGKTNKYSDIDVAVIAQKQGNFWKDRQRLSVAGLQVDNRIESHFFSKKDFSDINNPLVYEIRKTGIKIV